MGVLSGLKPEGVWKYFEDLCGIPHGSYNEKAVSDYCVDFAKKRGLEVYQDDAWNVVIIKEATAGYEDAEPLIIQGHLDMVCEKKPDSDFDFEKDGLRLNIDGDYVYAEGTTLGGDDGIAIAYALAILDDDSMEHPRLEAVFTTSEEVGMDGAMALDMSMLKGHQVLNLDSEEEGVLLVGCAGGCSTIVTLPLRRKKAQGLSVTLMVSGLKGGHSGVEIDKGRGNANILMARILAELKMSINYQLLHVEGGRKDNAIPRECRAELLIAAEQAEQMQKFCAEYDAILKKEYAATDADVSVSVSLHSETEAGAVDEDSLRKMMALLNALPNGIQSMSGDIEGLVETSLNLGVLMMNDEEIMLRHAVRSSVGSAREWLVKKMALTADICEAALKVSGVYPAWEYRRDSRLREDMVWIYEQMFGATPKVQAIHAGLECGILASKIADMDCVSMGPNMQNIHTTEERISISSVGRMWDYIQEIMKRK